VSYWYKYNITSQLTTTGFSFTQQALAEPTPTDQSRNVVNQQHLKQAWDVSQVSTREDWLEWRRRLAVEFLKESPSHALRACKTLADTHLPLALELFNAAFVSCWTELFELYQVRLLGYPDLRRFRHATIGGSCTID
jgi:phosphatidylinositol kinase/protein kinase (PI-3  family)